MSRRSPGKASYLTVTDQFCGAGGSSIGAVAAGIELRMALNHWKLAIETHNTNFPTASHDCTDISAADPRRYPATDILITSPECTTHSPAGGSRKSNPQRDIFMPHESDPATARSRATMFDVPRFAEYHRYRIIVCENVVEVLKWELFQTWLQAMDVLGYRHRIVSANSVFHHPTPQSRDRVYIVFWRKGNRAPRLDHTPAAHCPQCERVVLAIQTWKAGRTVGKHRRQYFYACPSCQAVVEPYYFAALNALDLSLPGQRIGDREVPLRPRTMERVRYGLEKFGRMALVIRTNMTTDRGYGPGDGGRVKPATDPMATQPTSNITGVATPPGFLVETAYTQANGAKPRELDQPLPAQSTRLSAALVALPFTVSAGGRDTAPRGADEPAPTMLATERVGMVMPFLLNGHMSRRVYGSDEALATQAASREHDSIVVPPGAIVANRTSNRAKGLDEPMPGVCTGDHLSMLAPAAVVPIRGHNTPKPLETALDSVCATGNHHALVSGAAVVALRGGPGMPIVRGLDQPLGAQVATCTQEWLLQPAPFLMSYQNNAFPLDDAARTITVLERHALVQPADPIDVEDCYFRMLQPHEIGAAMAFPGSYKVLGNKRDQVKQYGNAVTPPVMAWLIQRCIESLHPEKAA